MKNKDNIIDIDTEMDIGTKLRSFKKDKRKKIKTIERQGKFSSSTFYGACETLPLDFDFQVENKRVCDKNLPLLKLINAECAMDALNHIEDIFIRLLNNGYACEIIFDTLTSGSVNLKFSKAFFKKEKDIFSVLLWIASNYGTYEFHSDKRQLCFADDIFSNVNSLTIVLTPFSKIAQWPDGENMVCALRDLMKKVSHHGV